MRATLLLAAWTLASMSTGCRSEASSHERPTPAAADSLNASAGAVFDAQTLQAVTRAEYARDSAAVPDAALHARAPLLRVAAARALARIADAPAADRLLLALADESPQVTRWAAFGLGHACRGREREVSQALVLRAASWLASEQRGAEGDDALQAIAAALGRCATDDAERGLRGWLQAGPSLAEASALALGRLASRRGRLEEASSIALLDAASRREAALENALDPFTRMSLPEGALQGRLLEVASAALTRAEPSRSFALRALARLGTPGLPPLARLLTAPDSEARARAEVARELAGRGPEAERVLAESLVPLLSFSDAQLARQAAGPDFVALHAALQALATRPAAGRDALRRLAELALVDAPSWLRARQVALRCEAARLLAGSATLDSALRSCDPDPQGRAGKLAVIAVLDRGALRDARATRFRQLASDEEPLVQQAALRLLAGHPEFEGSAALLTAALGETAAGTLATAAELLAQHPERARGQRKAASLSTSLDPDLVEALSGAFRKAEATPNVGVRCALMDAAAVLGLLGLKADLTRACQSHNASLREHAERALRTLGAADARCVAMGPAPALEELTHAERGRVRLLFETELGELSLTLDGSSAPAAVTRLVELAHAGFYDQQRVHRVLAGFVTQLGDPAGDGFGGAPRPALPSELSPETFAAGDVGMALSGPDSASSQFFVTQGRFPHLDGEITRVGHASSGWDRLLVGSRILRVRVAKD